MKGKRPSYYRGILPVSLVTLALVGCSSEVVPEQLDAVMAIEGDAAAGATLYAAECQSCHEIDGTGMGSAQLPEIVPASSDEQLIEAMLSGPGIMPSFNELPDQDIADLLEYLVETWG